MRARSTDRAKAALGYLVAGLKLEPKGTYRFAHYSQSGQEATMTAPDGTQFIVRVLEVTGA